MLHINIFTLLIFIFMYDSKKMISEYTSLIKTCKTKNLVKAIIKLCKPLTLDIDFEEYFHNHFQIIQTLSGIKQAIVSDTNFYKKEVDSGYKIAMKCKENIPRLYTAMLFATISSKSNLIDNIITEISTIDNDMHRFIFRYSLLTLFSQKYTTFFTFTIENFDEMLIIYAKLASKYQMKPPETLTSCVISNVSLSLFGCENAPKEARLKLVEDFVGRSIKIQHLPISDTIMQVVQTIADNSLFLPTVMKFFQKADVNDSRCTLLGNMLLRHELNEAVAAAKETKYYQNLSPRFLQKAIKNNDISLARRIVSDCPTDDNLYTLCELLGFDKFFEDPPNIPKGSKFTVKVLASHCDAPASVIKKLIDKERDGDRSQELEHLIIRLFQVREVDFTREVINDHFVVDSRELYEVLQEKGVVEGITVNENKFSPCDLFRVGVPKLCEPDIQILSFLKEGNIDKIKELKSIRDSNGSKLPLITPGFISIITESDNDENTFKDIDVVSFLS